MDLKTDEFFKEDIINLKDTTHQNNEVVFFCEIGEYRLEVQVIRKDHEDCFLQVYKKNNIEIDVPMWLSPTIINFEVRKQRWKDLISVINRLEDISFEIKETDELSNEFKIVARNQPIIVMKENEYKEYQKIIEELNIRNVKVIEKSVRVIEETSELDNKLKIIEGEQLVKVIKP
ncbi:hypothetical protein J0795_29520 [Bacillus paranthracis]|uniref:hypothetical protein n=1 Tax=Bacillus paranthracis TaxID=2026186 RepID=UPI002FDBD62D